MASLQSTFLRFLLRSYITPHLTGSTIPELRSRMEASVRRVRPPAGTKISAVQADRVPAEWIATGTARTGWVMLYLHGGGFVAGSINTHRSLAARLSQASATRTLVLDYRLAPEHPFPAALDDCLAAYRWLLYTGIPAWQIVIAGDSAGGNLTLATLLALRQAGDALPAAAVCLSPPTDLAWTGESIRTKARHDPLLRPELGRSWVEAYIGTNDPCLPLISPLYADLHGLPDLLIHVGSDEILLSDAIRFAERAGAAGVDVQLEVWPHMWHVWHAFAPYLPEAQHAIAQIGDFVQRHLELVRVS